MTETKKDVLRPTDDEAIRLAKTLLRTARFGALAFLDPETGAPSVSRIAVATDHDGTPITLISTLAAHTGGLLAEPRCSLLVGEPGKGDPLAHPRMTIACRAEKVAADAPELERVRWRFLSRNPKSRLYSGFADFSFFRLVPLNASLNGGFGKAYMLEAEQLLTNSPAIDAVAAMEPSVVEHMNKDHADAVSLYATYYGKASEPASGWEMTGIDAEGFDLVAGERCVRIFFDKPLQEAAQVRLALVEMAAAARA